MYGVLMQLAIVPVQIKAWIHINDSHIKFLVTSLEFNALMFCLLWACMMDELKPKVRIVEVLLFQVWQ